MALISVPEGGYFGGRVRVGARVTRASVQSAASGCSTTGSLCRGSRSERPVRRKLPVPTHRLARTTSKNLAVPGVLSRRGVVGPHVDHRPVIEPRVLGSVPGPHPHPGPLRHPLKQRGELLLSAAWRGDTVAGGHGDRVAVAQRANPAAQGTAAVDLVRRDPGGADARGVLVT
jgi:hypothetical protein